MLFSNRATEFPLPEPAEVQFNLTLFSIIVATVAVLLLIFLVKDYFSIEAKALEQNSFKRAITNATYGIIFVAVVALVTSLLIDIDKDGKERKLSREAFITSITEDYGVEVRYISNYQSEDTFYRMRSEFVSLTVLDNGNKYECEALIFKEGTYAVYCGENTTKVALETLVD